MEQPTDSAVEAFRGTLAEERLRSARLVASLRFGGISAAFVLNLLVPDVIAQTHALQADVRLFACYWLAAAVVFWGKSQGVPILVSEETRRRVGDALGFRAAPATTVRGKSEPLQTYVPTPFTDPGVQLEVARPG